MEESNKAFLDQIEKWKAEKNASRVEKLKKDLEAKIEETRKYAVEGTTMGSLSDRRIMR